MQAQDGMSKDRLDRLLELVPVHMPRMTEMRSLVFRRPLHVWRSGEKEGDKDVVQELSASLWENFALEQQSQSAAVLARIMSPTWLIGTWLPVLPGNKNGQVKPLPGDAEDPAAKRTPSKLVKQDSIVGVLMSDNYLPNAQAQAKLRVHTSKLQQTLMMAVGTASIFGGMRKRRMQMEHMLKEVSRSCWLSFEFVHNFLGLHACLQSSARNVIHIHACLPVPTFAPVIVHPCWRVSMRAGRSFQNEAGPS